MKLSDGELIYLVDLIFKGMESLHCVRKEHIELLELYKIAGD
jgi:hypothetical protein